MKTGKANPFQGIAREGFILTATTDAHRWQWWSHNRKHYLMDDIELFSSS